MHIQKVLSEGFSSDNVFCVVFLCFFCFFLGGGERKEDPNNTIGGHQWSTSKMPLK